MAEATVSIPSPAAIVNVLPLLIVWLDPDSAATVNSVEGPVAPVSPLGIPRVKSNTSRVRVAEPVAELPGDNVEVVTFTLPIALLFVVKWVTWVLMLINFFLLKFCHLRLPSDRVFSFFFVGL